MADAINPAAQTQALADFETIYDILGTTVTILPLYGQDGSTGGKSLVTDASFTTVRATSSGLEAVFTWSEAPGSFDAPAVIKKQWRGDIPIVTFNGTDEEADSPDAAYWTRAGAAWSLCIWVKPTVVNTRMTFVSKFDETTGVTAREWATFMNASGQPGIAIWDDSASARISRLDATALTAGVWQQLIFVDGGTNASTGLDIYLNGNVVDDTTDDTGVFTAMEDTACLVRLGCEKGPSALANFFQGDMAGWGLGPCFVQAAITAAQAKRLYHWGAIRLRLL